MAGGIAGGNGQSIASGGNAARVEVENHSLSPYDFGKGMADWVSLEKELINDKTLTEQEKQAIRDHHLKGDLPEDVIKAILENNPGSDTVMALLQAKDTKDYAMALLTALPVERALAVLGKLGKDAGKGTTGNSAISELTGITQKQLDKKFKHAEDFGVITTKKNADTLSQYEAAIKNHMGDTATKPKGTYGFVKDSKVFFNSKTNNVVVLDKSGNFVTGFKLIPGTPQYENYIKNGVLR